MTSLEDRPVVDVELADLLLAAELVVTSQRASGNMLQRKMRLGWVAVNAVLDDLAEAGVVSGGGPGDRTVLVAPEDLADVLARLADPGEPGPGEDLAGPGELADEVPVVSLVKPGADLVIRPDDDIEIRQRGEIEQWEDDHQSEVQTLVARPRRVARALVRVADEPVVGRAIAVTRQAPKAGGRLILWSPRGVKRVVVRTQEWLVDAETLRLLAKHEAAGEGESYAKVADTRAKKNLAGRRFLAGAVAGLALVIGLAWWAPAAFAGILAGLAFLAVLTAGRSVAREPKELAWVAGAALALAGLAWWKGPDLATLIPQPPGWVWWVLAGVAVAAFGWLGRKEDQALMEMPARMAAHGPPPITAPMIVEALFRIGVPGMSVAAADKGMRDEIRVRAPGVAKAQHGYLIELELPPGITAGDVAKQREELAGALRRPLGCVWPSGGGDHPGHLRIYMGNKPMATAPQTAWPLAAGHPIDLFEPFPLFTDEEGRWVDVTLLGTHAVVAGASGFGKSVTLRQLGAAVGLDPRSRPYVFDGKISGDLAPMQKIAHAYYEGAEPEDIAETLAALQDIEKEMRRRARFLRGLPPDERSPKVTSALASKYAHLSPIVLLIDEVQEYTEYGVKGSKEDKEIRDAFIATLTRISRLGRSAGIAMVLVSQKPEASVIATAIMGNCAIRVCHKVTEQNHNDQVLGTSAYKNGYNAALFSQEDRGLAWLRAEGDPRVVRSWSAMVDLEPAIELADKAYALRKARGLLTGQATDDGIQDAEVVYDIVQDAEVVLRRHERGRAQWAELVEWLRDFRPTQYADLNVDGLSARMRNEGIKVSQVRIDGINRQGVRLSDLQKREVDDEEDR